MIILVDAINCLVLKNKGMNRELYNLLETYPQKKLVMTNADDKQIQLHKLNELPYDVFTLKHNPNKDNPDYYKTFLSEKNLTPEEVVYFEHNIAAVESARSVGITTLHYKDSIEENKKFLDQQLR